MQSVPAAYDRLRKVPYRIRSAPEVSGLPGTTSPVVGPDFDNSNKPSNGQQPVPLGGGRRTIILAVCCSALFMVGLDNTIVNVGLPSIGASLHTTVAGLQWTVAGYTIVLASL